VNIYWITKHQHLDYSILIKFLAVYIHGCGEIVLNKASEVSRKSRLVRKKGFNMPPYLQRKWEAV
jgi:hypothetical protein